ncbi:MAG: hypothetical protein D4R97_06880 [Bacteroidetes bacterium]|nr:MAG: hypothetical protein D4R97_06880 [Bacteroidota bacterium]
MESKKMITKFSFLRKHLPMCSGLLIMVFLVTSFVTRGQNDITVSLSVAPPYTPKIFDYFSQQNKTMLTVKNNTGRTIDAYMQVSVTDNAAITASSDPGFRRKLTLEPYGIFRMNQTNYDQIINTDHIIYKGITKQQVAEGNIPEGEYSICISAFDAKNYLISGEDLGCFSFTIKAVEPPVAIRPECGTNIKEMTPQNVLFSWTIPAGAPAITDYTVKIIEVYPSDKNLVEAMMSPSHQVFFEKKMNANSCLLGPADPALITGKRYAFAVIASDPNKVITFNNNGLSDVCDFTYGGGGIGEIIPDKTGLVEIQLLEPTDSIQNTTPPFKWQPKTDIKNSTYSLKIVELLDGQVPIEALERNKPLWTVSGIKELYTRYPFGKPALDSNKTYVWTVEAIGKDGSTKGKGGAKGFTLVGATAVTFECLCGIEITEPPTIFYKCQHDGSFDMQPYGFFISNCHNYGKYWRNENNFDKPSTGIWSINPDTLTCGIHVFHYIIKNNSDNTVYCSEPYTVYIYPDYITIKNTVTGEIVDNLPSSPPLNFCTGDFGELAIPSCSTFPVTWGFRDNSGPFQTWCGSSLSPCTDNPIATNQLNVSSCPNHDGNGDSYLSRIYQAAMTAPAGFVLWPCSQIQKITTKIYCKSQCGTFTVASSTGHTLIPTTDPNTWKVCSATTSGGAAVYPIGIHVHVAGYTGHVTSWDPGTGNDDYYNAIYDPGSTNPYTVTYKVHIKNGQCEEVICSVNFIVWDPYIPAIDNKKDWVCPNKEDDVLCISNTGFPAGGTIQWQYQINCTGAWHSTYGPGNGNCQNTNLIGNNNPYYSPPIVYPSLSSSLCWRAVFVPPSNDACAGNTNSTVPPAAFHGLINLCIKPGIPHITVNPPPPQCCGTVYTFTATPPSTGTAGWSWMWYKDGVPLTGILPDMTGRTFTATEPGDYYVVVYNKNLCDNTKSNVIHLTCCSVNVKLDAPCCVDGITPVSITVYSSSTCGNQIKSLTITGCDGFSFSFANPPPALVVPINPYPSYPAPTPACPSDREWLYTVTVKDNMVPPCIGTASIIIKTCPK